MKLQGRRAIITGASQGLGAEIAYQFIGAGASVMLCARGLDELETFAQSLKPSLAQDQKLHIARCDVSSTEDVDRLIEASLSKLDGVEILVNNAGVYGPMGALDDVTWQDWVEALQINLYGTVYPCRAILPHFRARGYGKIINLSGGGATNPLPRISAYAASKAAVVRFTETLALEVSDAHIDVNAIAPGALNTRLMDQLIEAGAERVGEAFHLRMLQVQSEGGTPLSKGAALCVYLASAESDGITGKLVSAVWDPWAQLQQHRSDLDKTDIYTLRRIVPKDRGFDWGDA